MLDIFMGYLVIFILLLGGTISLFLNEFNVSKIKYMFIISILSILLFVIFLSSNYLANYLLFLNNYFGFLFVVIAIILLIIDYIYLKYGKSYIFILGVSFLFLVMILSLSSQMRGISILDSLGLTVFLFIFLILLYPISSLLHYARRDYFVVVGEFLSIEIVLFILLGLTYCSLRDFDYSLFNSFLILTPTYQLVYVVVVMIVILLIGLYYNDKQLKKR